jgi:4-amino-4-deoxy-L-arabinose transferase-like glycosyltransferase
MSPAPSRARRSTRAWTDERLVPVLVCGAFALRLVVRQVLFALDPHQGRYDFYLSIARTFERGGGLCESPGHACALRLPFYPLLVWPFVTGDTVSVGLIAVEAAIGAALVYVTYRIGCELFNSATGLLAAGALAVSPYALVHDTALQDTVLVNALVGTSVWLLLTLRRPVTGLRPVLAGTALALALLTTARIALIVPCAVGWTLLCAGPSWSVRRRHAALVMLPLVILVGGWLARNARAVGTPVLTTESGESLWVANNAWTMNHFPSETIDLSVRDSYASLTAGERAALRSAGNDEVAFDRILGRWGRDFIVAHPMLTLGRAAIKVAVPLIAYLSPARSPIVEAGFAVVYLPLHALAAIAAWRVRLTWRPHLLPCVVFGAFLVTTAIFWAHTSHATLLDPLWCVYAASIVTASWAPSEPQC